MRYSRRQHCCFDGGPGTPASTGRVPSPRRHWATPARTNTSRTHHETFWTLEKHPRRFRGRLCDLAVESVLLDPSHIRGLLENPTMHRLVKDNKPIECGRAYYARANTIMNSGKGLILGRKDCMLPSTHNRAPSLVNPTFSPKYPAPTPSSPDPGDTPRSRYQSTPTDYWRTSDHHPHTPPSTAH
jgi:hypothetical protein